VRRAITENLSRFTRVQAQPALKPAAVAIVVMNGGPEARVPVFQRTQTMSRHASQMALPGGRLHPGESAEECAIREAFEELGLVLETRDLLGPLDDFNTKSGFTITPLVFWSETPESALRPSKSEVQRLFTFTLDEVRAAVAAANLGESPEFSLRFRPVEIFAPTAAMLYQFSEVALDGRPCRVADFYQPPFTHR
jgi:8-oxo-dGTP pyrophosphatase MutT (NUDIX family)